MQHTTVVVICTEYLLASTVLILIVNMIKAGFNEGYTYDWMSCLWLSCLMNDFSGGWGFQRWWWEILSNAFWLSVAAGQEQALFFFPFHSIFH